MDCLKYQAMITPFIKGELNDREKEEFLRHVEVCGECREELEIYYILLTSMKQLDEDKDLSDDFHQELVKLLKKTSQEIESHKRKKLRQRFLFVIMIAAVIFLFGIRFGNTEIEKELPEEEQKNLPEVSHFELKFRFLDQGHCFFHRAIPEEDIIY